MNTAIRTALGMLAALALAACGGGAPDAHEHHDEAGQHAHGDEHGHEEEEAARGPHGGRLLADGDFVAELAIFEDGVPPQFRLYVTHDGKPVDPAALQASVALRRINGVDGGVVDQHVFTPAADHLVSGTEVYEPHSFEVTVRVEHAGKTHEWHYDSPEGMTTIPAPAAAKAGIVVAQAGPGRIADELRLFGRIVPDAQRVSRVHARFPGPVREVRVQAGDAVKAGQTLAIVESNESLQTYAVTAPLGGTVTARLVNPGEEAAGEPLFEIVDASTVWAELSIFPRDRAGLAVGQAAVVAAAEGETRGEGRIRFISPTGGESQAVTARVVLDNGNRQWTPGQFVEARVQRSQHAASLVVPLGALQRFRDWDVVFVQEGDRFQTLPVRTGRRDATQVAIEEGLLPGARVVTAASWLVKADIEKSGASHDH